MLLTPELITLVLFAALLHATWNALVKQGGDRLLILAAVNGCGMLVGALGVPLLQPPAPASWIYLLLSIVLHFGYYYFLLQAYRFGDLSHVYPLARGAAPLLVLLGGLWAAGETLPGGAVVGVLLASAGIISLAFDRGLPWWRDPRPVLYALGTSLFIAAYTVVDGLGVRASGSPAGYIFWLFFLDGWPLLLFALARRRRQLWTFLAREWRIGLGGGLAAITGYGLVIYAMSRGAMAAVSALRETSVIMAVLIGTWLLGERFGARRMAAACLVTLGVGLMNVLH
ncbi:MAG TPA: EamA family transporter [Candidatus Competibacteraceae bacterium]|nr:EamA family transporter [Candidatus Competibacteraceae bacterium]